ncbi:hypothetical protein JW964_25125, partial [candidate division KSB1 bacterium]|nr:hypothetical protein [candidate division KSB1 bacterium]
CVMLNTQKIDLNSKFQFSSGLFTNFYNMVTKKTKKAISTYFSKHAEIAFTTISSKSGISIFYLTY